MDEKAKLYVHWIFCIQEKCERYINGCPGAHERCLYPVFLPLEDIEADKRAALEKYDSPSGSDIPF
jgi:hypothetical protein